MKAVYGPQTLGAYTVAQKNLLADPGMLEGVVGAAGATLDRIAWEQFADPVGPRNVQMSDAHADFFIRNQVAVTVEGRFFVRRNPNPMPQIVVFGPRVDAAIDRLQARVTGIRLRVTRNFRRLSR